MTRYRMAFQNKPFIITGIKIEIEALGRAIQCLDNIGYYRREITGIIDQEEEQVVKYCPSEEPLPPYQEDVYLLKCKTLRDQLPAEITRKSLPELLQTLLDIFKEHIPVVDLRMTSAEAAKQKTKEAREKKIHLLKINEQKIQFLEDFGRDDKVFIPRNEHVICLDIVYDDWDRKRRRIIPEQLYAFPLLLDCPQNLKRANQSSLYKAVYRYPELASLEWETCMPRNEYPYLRCLSETGISRLIPGSDGERFAHLYYMVKYHDGGKEFYVYRNFPGGKIFKPEPINQKVSVKLDAGLIIIEFRLKPGTETMNFLRSQGFYWHWRHWRWQASYSEERMKAIQERFVNHPSISKEYEVAMP